MKSSTGLATAFAIATVGIFIGICDGSWNYDDRDWGGDCKKQRQSPVNIETKYTKHEDWEPVELSGCDFTKVKIKLDPGKGLKFEGDDFSNCKLKKAGLSKVYKLGQFHFHWKKGSTGCGAKGSEHTVNGMSYPLEGHFVFYDDARDNLTAALESGQGDALAVIGIFYMNTADSVPPHFEKIQNALGCFISQTCTTKEVDLSGETVQNFLPEKINDYYRYEGSLTTPTCNEQVIWTVMSTPKLIYISALKAIHEAGSVSNLNYRETQPLNGREITCVGKCHSGASSSSESAVVVTVLAAVAAFLAGRHL